MLGHKLPDGRVAMGMLREWSCEPGAEISDRDVADAVVEEWGKWRPKRIGYNSHVSGGVIHLLARRRLPLIDLKGTRYFVACGMLHELVKTAQLVHDNDPTVRTHIGWAVKQDTRDKTGWYFDRRKSPGPIYAADGAAMLAWLTSPRSGSATGVVTLAG